MCKARNAVSGTGFGTRGECSCQLRKQCKPARKQKAQSTHACHDGKLRTALLPMTGRLPCGRGGLQKPPEASDFSTVVTKSLALVASTNIRTTSSQVQPKGLANKLATAVALPVTGTVEEKKI